MKVNRSVALARVSSRSQEDGYSLDAQCKLLRGYCEDNTLRLIREFRISETASKNEQRKTFRELLEYIEDRKIDHLIVEKTDRLTRNFRDAVVVDDWLEQDENRRLHMVKEGLIIHKRAKSDAKLMWNIYLAIAKKYTDNLREEAMKGWDEKLAQGWMPSQPPAGYKNARQNSRTIHVINEDTAFMIERGFRLFMEPGQCVRTIAQEFRECGLVNSKNRPYAESAVHKILRNPYYVGTICFNRKYYPGAHEPLIDDDLFRAVQKKLSRRNSSRAMKHNVLLRGFIVCTTCKHMVTWSCQKGRYYGACPRRTEMCKGFSNLRLDRAELAVIDHIDQLNDRDHKIFRELKKILIDRKRPFSDVDIEKILKMQRSQVRKLEIMSNNLYDDKLAGDIDAETYIEKSTYYAQRIKRLLSKIEHVEGYRADKYASYPGSSKHALKKIYVQGNKTEKRIILNHLFSMSMVYGKLVISDKHAK